MTELEMKMTNTAKAIYESLFNHQMNLRSYDYKGKHLTNPNSSIEKLVDVGKVINSIAEYAVETAKQKQILINENNHLRQQIDILNERCSKPKSKAGRRSKFNNEQKNRIIEMSINENMSMGRIAEEMDCSKGLVHKIIHEWFD